MTATFYDGRGKSATSLANLKRFPKGVSGNPHGPSLGIVQYAKSKTNDARDLIDFMADIFRVEGQFQGARIPLHVRMDAATWLMERCYGKPSQSTEIRVDIEQRVLTLAAEMGIDPVEATAEMTRVIEAGKS